MGIEASGCFGQKESQEADQEGIEDQKEKTSLPSERGGDEPSGCDGKPGSDPKGK